MGNGTPAASSHSGCLLHAAVITAMDGATFFEEIQTGAKIGEYRS